MFFTSLSISNQETQKTCGAITTRFARTYSALSSIDKQHDGPVKIAIHVADPYDQYPRDATESSYLAEREREREGERERERKR